MELEPRVAQPRVPITRELFAFLEELAHFDDRDWFKANKAHMRAPLLSFVADLGEGTGVGF